MQISGFLVTPLRTFRNTRGSGADGGRLDEFVGVTLGQNRSERLNPPLGEGSACAVRFVRLFRGQDRDERYCGGDGGIRTLDTPLERITV